MTPPARRAVRLRLDHGLPRPRRARAPGTARCGRRQLARRSRWRRSPSATASPARPRDWRGLAADPGIDAVVVGTPNSLHAEQAIACLEAGKHVLVEKPMATTLAEAEAMNAAADASARC